MFEVNDPLTRLFYAKSPLDLPDLQHIYIEHNNVPFWMK